MSSIVFKPRPAKRIVKDPPPPVPLTRRMDNFGIRYGRSYSEYLRDHARRLAEAERAARGDDA